jgi:hypothetical protein
MSCGLRERLERRLLRPAYATALIAMLDVPLATRQAVVRQVFAEREACLPQLVRRLREMRPSEADFLERGRCILDAWRSSVFLAIFEVERQRALFRSLLQSGGPGKTGAFAANCFMAQRCHEYHVRAGGRPVERCDPWSAMSWRLRREALGL